MQPGLLLLVQYLWGKINNLKNHNVLFITVRTVLLKAMTFGWSLALGLWPTTAITPVDYIQYNTPCVMLLS